MKALVLAPFESNCLRRLRARMEVVHESWLESRRLYSPEDLAARINDEKLNILIVEADFVFGEVFEETDSLGFVGICRNATTQIDLEAATEHGVVVVNTPGRNAVAVAELVFGLMLSMARRIVESHNYVASGAWNDPVSPYLELRGIELDGKTMGVIGLGSIGMEVAKRAGALGMRVLAYDPYLTETSSRRGDVTMVSLQELLAASDFVSVHVPAGAEAAGIIGGEGLKIMKSSAFLINTSNPLAIDRNALEEALREGRIAGVALDVHEAAPLSPDNPIVRLPNVILTPHIGGATDGTVERHSLMMTEDIESFLAGECPPRIVNPSVWRHGA